MNFTDLYRFVNELELSATPFRSLSDRVVSDHPRIGEVLTYQCALESNFSLGHIKYETDRSSAYGEEYDVAVIRYDLSLNRCWTRIVCTKELMHVFDDSEERSNSPSKFLKLLRELETRPLPDDASEMYRSEYNCEWKAFLVLCPARLRAKHISRYKSDGSNDDEIANSLKIPSSVVSYIMSDYYNRALEVLTGEPAIAI